MTESHQIESLQIIQQLLFVARMEHKQEPKVDHAVEQTPQENHSSPSAMADSTPTSNHADGKPEENRDTESGLPGLEEQDDDGEDNAVAPTGVGVVRKKKKKSKSKSKRGLVNPAIRSVKIRVLTISGAKDSSHRFRGILRRCSHHTR